MSVRPASAGGLHFDAKARGGRFIINGMSVTRWMTPDLTQVDSDGWGVLRSALNRRMVPARSTLVQSKRNRVWVVETDVRPVVLKQFLSGRCSDEFEALLRARKAGIDVPYPFHKESEMLVMEYVPGESCEMMINHMFSSDVADGLGRWLAGFHTSLGDGADQQLMGDAVLSNFLYHDGRVYGVDLEDTRPGDALEDLGQMVASVLCCEPMFSPVKFDLSLRLLSAYEAASGRQVAEAVKPFVSKHIMRNSLSRPLFRRTFAAAARTLERGWPDLA